MSTQDPPATGIAPRGVPPSPARTRSRWRTLRQHFRRHGFWSTIALLIMQPLQQLQLLRIGGVYLTPTSIAEHPPFALPLREGRFLDTREITRLVEQGAEWFFPDAVAQSLRRSERCFAVLIDGSVTSTRWYASGPLRQFGVYLKAQPGMLFEHRVHTDPMWRGHGLAVEAQRQAAAALRTEGIEWMIATIDLVNASSRTAFRKAGAFRVGWIVQFGPDAWQQGVLVRTSACCPLAYRESPVTSA